jgi:tripartite-type tricarboxylate transporter receptor subunit TctC
MAQPRTLTLIVGGAAGVTYDTYARLLSRHFGRHFPGSPSIVVQNMPGAGSTKAAEYMYALAPKDGATFALLFPGALISPLMDTAQSRFDPTKFEYLGTLEQDTRACVTSGRSRVKTFEDARTHTSIMAGTQHGSSTVDYPHLLNAVAGTRFKVVSGYKSTNETILAIERGEADGMCSNLGTFLSQKPDWLDAPAGQAIVAMGIEDHPEMTKRKVPYIGTFLSGEPKAIVDLVVSQQGFGRPFLVPPGTPAPAVATLRQAFEATYNDKAFLSEAATMKLDINPLDGDKVGALIKQMYATPKSVVDATARALRVVR